MTDEEILDEITKIRARNNGVWMGLLEIALKSAPKEAKALLALVNENDREISKLLAELAV
jgi:hypothetical protein